MIGPNTTVRGSIKGSEDLTIQGTVEGTIELEGDLSIDSEAHVQAEVSATKVTIATGAEVTGTLKTQHLTLEEGARFKGRIEMNFEIEGLELPEPQQKVEQKQPVRRR